MVGKTDTFVSDKTGEESLVYDEESNELAGQEAGKPTNHGLQAANDYGMFAATGRAATCCGCAA